MKVNNSGAVCYQTCPRKYKLSFVDRITPIIESEALHIGSIFHLGVENRSIPNEIHQLDDKNKAMVEGMIDLALKTYDAPAETEKLMSARLDNGFELYGTIDEITHDGYICDWKTASRKADPENYRLQLSKYVWLARQNGYDIKGARVKVVYKSMIRKKKSENENEYYIRLYNEYKNAEKYTETFDLDISDDEIQKELENFTEICKMIEYSTENNVFPMDLKRCKDYGKCEFYELCHELEGSQYLYREKREDEV